MGEEVQVIANTLILEEGASIASLFIVLQGLLRICSSALPGSSVACVGPGAMGGDISLRTGGSVSADVRVMENSLLLEVPVAVLLAKMDEDAAFGLRMYHALTHLNAARLIETTRKWNAELTREEINSGRPACLKPSPSSSSKSVTLTRTCSNPRAPRRQECRRRSPAN